MEDEINLDPSQKSTESADLAPVVKKKKGTHECEVGVLPDEVWEHIFSRLPIFSFHKLNCVSRSWRNLCSEAEAVGKAPSSFGIFAKVPCGRHRRLTWKFFPPLLDDRNRKQHLRPRFLPCCKEPWLEVEHTCNGLLLCSTSRSYRSCQTLTYYVCNPLTNAWTEIPDKKEKKTPEVALLFDPSASIHFKILCFLSQRIQNGQIGIDVFSSESWKWDVYTARGDVPDVCLNEKPWPVYVRGVFYRIVEKQSILGLQAEAKTLFLLKPPDAAEAGGKLDDYLLKEWEGELHFVRNLGSELLVWKLEDPSKSKWVLNRRVAIEDCLELHPVCKELRWYFLPLVMHPNLHEVLHLVGEEEEGGQVYHYDLRSNRLRMVGDLEDNLQSLYEVFKWRRPVFHFAPRPVKFFTGN